MLCTYMALLGTELHNYICGLCESGITAQGRCLACARMRRCCVCLGPVLNSSERRPSRSLNPGIVSGSVSVPSVLSRLRISALSYTCPAENRNF